MSENKINLPNQKTNMNRTEIIEKIIRRLGYDSVTPHDTFRIKQILEEELPDFQRIDEERFKRIYASKVCDIGLHIQEYNSTLPPALVPLPKEMPEWFHGGHNFYKLWNLVCHNYGTPEPKQPLPSVEELMDEMLVVYKRYGNDLRSVVEHLHDKYSLHPREEKGFPFNLKKGDKFIDRDGFIRIFNGTHIIESIPGELHYIEQITPYIEPTIEQKFINSLTPEQMVMYKELNNENHNSGK